MGEVNKFHALQLFTDTFSAETVHLTNQAVGIYIRLLCFAWTKNTKPFTSESAYRICQCIDDNCKFEVDKILHEFFIKDYKMDTQEVVWTHKRLVQEHEYLTDKYQRKSKAGKKGAEARYSANGNIMAPIPSPMPIPNNKYDQSFEILWKALECKRGSKFKAFKLWQKLGAEMPNHSTIINIYNKQIEGVERKYIPHFTTWLSEKRWEIEDQEVTPNLIERMQKLGYLHKGREDNYEKFAKDGKNYKIDIYDTKHQLILEH